jgi:hypothetical protein
MDWRQRLNELGNRNLEMKAGVAMSRQRRVDTASVADHGGGDQGERREAGGSYYNALRRANSTADRVRIADCDVVLRDEFYSSKLFHAQISSNYSKSDVI